MARRKDIPTNTYRFMCERLGNTNYHIEFETKEEAMAYVEELNDNKISWYGVYEVDVVRNILITVTHKRLFETTIHLPAKEESPTNSKPHRRKRHI